MACTLLERLSSSVRDNFTLMRYIAAACVILGHSYPLIMGADVEQPLKNLIGIHISGLGLAAFFVISGFLLAQSWNKDPSLRFFWKRFLRLYPELIAVIFLTVFIIGPLNTDLGIDEYFGQRETWDYFKHLTLFFYNDSLPGVFMDNPCPGPVNGSLWVLPYFFMLYVVLFLYGTRGLLNKRSVIMVIHAIVLMLIIFYPIIFPRILNVMYIPFMANTSLLKFYIYFSGGILLYLYRDRVKLDYKIVLLLIGVPVVFSTLMDNYMANYMYAVIPYFVIYFSFISLGPLSRAAAMHDCSYGLFIYSYPVQQTIAHFAGGLAVFEMFIATMLITFPIAVLSMYMIGKPALRLKRAKILVF